ncbi:hypothetical protein ECEPECA14_1065 [Escherichia coli EPECa14]|nr:hypothetical protein ECEPECA14_1065 [Escherichia coli EPECa14]EHW18423.1 hypothetical protein ECDEC8C_2505 [Escherichia coli DEC8C]EHW26899.1 hypothetical protein ECDEC8D_2161 [Escherichia coli DEC8D]
MLFINHQNQRQHHTSHNTRMPSAISIHKQCVCYVKNNS